MLVEECYDEVHNDPHQCGGAVQRLDLVNGVAINLVLPLDGLGRRMHKVTPMPFFKK